MDCKFQRKFDDEKNLTSMMPVPIFDFVSQILQIVHSEERAWQMDACIEGMLFICPKKWNLLLLQYTVISLWTCFVVSWNEVAVFPIRLKCHVAASKALAIFENPNFVHNKGCTNPDSSPYLSVVDGCSALTPIELACTQFNSIQVSNVAAGSIVIVVIVWTPKRVSVGLWMMMYDLSQPQQWEILFRRNSICYVCADVNRK